MVSPFPGMDPYLEDPAIRPDFHGTFLVHLRADLNKRLPKHYVARWDRHVWIDSPDLDYPKLLGKPDIFVADKLSRTSDETMPGILDAPATALMPMVELEGKPFVKIIDVRTHRVVTALELLSHSNKKPGPDRDAYLAKRKEYFKGGVNLVEMDFLRSGTRPDVDSQLKPSDYFIIVSRAVDYPQAGVWPFGIRDEFPTLLVPLDAQMDPVEVAL